MQQWCSGKLTQLLCQQGVTVITDWIIKSALDCRAGVEASGGTLVDSSQQNNTFLLQSSVLPKTEKETETIECLSLITEINNSQSPQCVSTNLREQTLQCNVWNLSKC